MTRLFLILTVLPLLFSCDQNDLILANGNLIINNNSNSDIFIEVIALNKYVLTDSVKLDQITSYNIECGVKKLAVYDKNGGTLLKNISVIPNQNNKILVLSSSTITVTNNRNIPVYFYYQRYFSGKRPTSNGWQTYSGGDHPEKIEAGQSIDINLINGHKYWGSVITNEHDSPGINKILFRVNEDLSPVIL